MKNYKVTVGTKPFFLNIKGLGVVDIHKLSDEQAEKLHKSGSKLVEPIPTPKPKTDSK